MLWELLAADIERVEGIGAVGTVFEKVFFGLRLLLHRLVLAEAVATSLHSCGLDSEDKVIVVLAVEVRHQSLLPGKTLVDEKRFLIMSHRDAEVHVNDLLAVALEFHIERFEDVQAVGTWLTAHNPVDIGVVVHTNAERLHRVDVRVRATVERAVERGELVSCVDGVKILLRLTDYFVIAERVEVVKIRRIIFMVLLHTPRASYNAAILSHQY